VNLNSNFRGIPRESGPETFSIRYWVGFGRQTTISQGLGLDEMLPCMDRNYLAGPQGDAINAVLAAVGYNFRLLLNWLRLLLYLIVSAILPRSQAAVRLQTA